MVTPADRLAQLEKTGETAKVAIPDSGTRVAERSNADRIPSCWSMEA
ncbi:unnamed protein product [Acanthoscelides obtectus]|uniref:Uncharacterized protein n=1 Tax=Acanthoscelides obtectus TaxID=200917 RepID=A0A9P0PSP0_ACAOB|nr:unnamed protein product [Acanthoscelides obtectus]CAK1632885.1 hypothetical protein AOBTE_LOCUS7790 [Acanthoscelides obtectus]